LSGYYLCGFLNDRDAGVPYLSEISFVGKHMSLNGINLVNDDAPGFGASHANYETKEIEVIHLIIHLSWQSDKSSRLFICLCQRKSYNQW